MLLLWRANNNCVLLVCLLLLTASSEASVSFEKWNQQKQRRPDQDPRWLQERHHCLATVSSYQIVQSFYSGCLFFFLETNNPIWVELLHFFRCTLLLRFHISFLIILMVFNKLWSMSQYRKLFTKGHSWGVLVCSGPSCFFTDVEHLWRMKVKAIIIS